MIKKHWPILFAAAAVIAGIILGIVASNSTDTGVALLMDRGTGGISGRSRVLSSIRPVVRRRGDGYGNVLVHWFLCRDRGIGC